MSYRGSIVALSTLASLVASAPAAAQVELRNDGYESGGSAGFQGGFVSGEEFAATLVPEGSGPLQVLSVQLLFGGATTTENVTLRIFEDPNQDPDPGALLYMGDFALTGSDSQLSEIDLASDNVVVNGAFRVSFEVAHDGFPGPARDDDGNIAATRNWVNAVGTGWIQSSSLGILGDWVVRAVVDDDGGMPDGGVGGASGAGGSGGTGGGDPCSINSDCPEGQYCGPGDTCRIDCRLDTDCAPGEQCNALGQCVSTGGGGGGCAVRAGKPVGGALLLFVVGALLFQRRRALRG